MHVSLSSPPKRESCRSWKSKCNRSFRQHAEFSMENRLVFKLLKEKMDGLELRNRPCTAFQFHELINTFGEIGTLRLEKLEPVPFIDIHPLLL